MKNIKYFLQFLFVILSFIIFKIIGPNLSSSLSGKIFQLIGPLFRSKKIIHTNIKRAIPNIDSENLEKITKLMWNNYGRIFAEYMFIKDFRHGKLEHKIKIEGQEILDEIKKYNKQVIFISGHFCNFELMAMHLEKSGINLSAIYRPLNNIFLNGIMEGIREKYICKHQIKKGIQGVREAIEFIKKNHCLALMIDQRVSEGEKINFFGKSALTTTLPAQLSIKFGIDIIPVYIERSDDNKFKLEFQNRVSPKNFKDKIHLTKELNKILEKMIIKNPNQWIWTHNRWK